MDRGVSAGVDRKVKEKRGTMNKKELVIITCPPLSDYPEAPKAQSRSELFDCPKCNAKMWLSSKKKGLIMFSACLDRDILLACYPCIEKEVRTTSDRFRDHEMVNI